MTCDSGWWKNFLFLSSISQARFEWTRREDLKNEISQELRAIESDTTHNHLIDSHLCWMTLNLERSKDWKFFLTFLFHVRPKENFHSNFENSILRNNHNPAVLMVPLIEMHLSLSSSAGFGESEILRFFPLVEDIDFLFKRRKFSEQFFFQVKFWQIFSEGTLRDVLQISQRKQPF